MPTASARRIAENRSANEYHRDPAMRALRLSHVQLYILSPAVADVGSVQLRLARPFRRKYGLFVSRAMVSSAATPDALLVLSPHITITRSTFVSRRRNFSFQSPVNGSLSDLSTISKGESGCLACPARRFRRSSSWSKSKLMNACLAAILPSPVSNRGWRL